jgi:hypothetical protein
MRPSLRQVLFRSAGLDLNFAGGVFSLNNTRTASPAAIPGWSFSRTDTNGTATALDLAGNVIQFATGAPRITNRGILVEEARTNLLLNSAFAGGGAAPTSWTQPVATGTSAPATSTITTAATAYQQSGTAQRPYLTQQVTVAVGTYTVSVYVESVTGSVTAEQMISYGGGTATVSGVAHPACPANPSGGNTSPINAGLLLFSITVTGAGTLSPRVGLGVNAGGATGTVRFSLPQTELGAFATSPIITTGAAGTRGADAVTMGSFVFPAAHTFVVETQAPVLQTGLFPTSFSSTGTNVGLLVTGSTNVSGANMGNATFNDVYGSAVSAGGTIKNAFRAETNNARGCLNGTLSALDATFTPVVGSQTLNIGAANGSASYWNSYVQRIRILPTAISDAQLQALTAP